MNNSSRIKYMRLLFIILLLISISAQHSDAQAASIFNYNDGFSQAQLNQFSLVEYELPLLVYKDRVTLMNLSTLYSDPLSINAQLPFSLISML